MKTLQSFLISCLLISSTAMGWYPEYSVMASDFVLGEDFMAPVQYNSMTIYALGESFRDIYSSPLDDLGRNPAATIKMDSRHFVHLDLGSQKLFDGEDVWGTSPVPLYGVDYYMPWSYYRQGEEKAEYDPAFRFVYIGYPLPALKNTRIGFSYDWMYELSEFYQPYDSWGFGMRDAVGNTYESSDVDPYDDYRLREAGDDENVNEGYNLTFFLAHPLGSNTDLGARFTISGENVDGNLYDYDFDDQNDYRDEYYSLYESRKKREQAFNSRDVMLGLNTKLGSDAEFGISAGLLTGKLDRIFNEQDTSNYYSLTLDQYPQFTLDDSSFYSRTSDHQSEKEWNYDGHTYYGGIQYYTTGDNGLNYRFALYVEQRQSDLTESESLYQSNNYSSKYFYYYDTSLTQRTSTSWATVARSGTGEFLQQLYRGSAGLEWEVSSGFKFLGGITVYNRDRQQTSSEPFSGKKYSKSVRTGNYSGSYLSTQLDKKTFSWDRREHEFMVGLPVGVMLNFGQFFQIRSGFSKIFRKTEITEKYDVIVKQYRSEVNNDGVIILKDEQNYVDGYEFPDIRTFDSGFDFNAGLSFVYSDNFSASVVYTKAFHNDRMIKLGGQFSW